jgi:hypothetical protein
MTVYDPSIVSSSTAIIFAGAQYLFSTIWSFLPVVLTVVIPLGILFGVYHLLKGKAKLK